MPRPPLEIGTYGSISTRKHPGGAWVATARVRDRDGVTRSATASGASKAASENALKKKLRDRFTGPANSALTPEMTIEQLGKVWLERQKRREDLQQSSVDFYDQQLKVINKKLKKVRLREAGVQCVDAFLQGQLAKSSSAARSSRTVLSLMLAYAAEMGVIPANPVKSLKNLPRTKKTPRALAVDDLPELRRLVREWQDRERPGPKSKDILDIIDLHLATGCRIGEVLALRWCDIDFEKGTVTVAGTVVSRSKQNGGGTARTPRPKTESGYRKLFLPEWALDILRRRAETCDMAPDAPVFPARGGKWKSPHNVRRIWRDIRKGTRFEWVKPHTFRKTVATLVDDEADTSTASKVLGHSDEKVTKDHYIAKPDQAPDVRFILDKFAPEDDEGDEPGDTDEPDAGAAVAS